MDSVLVKSKRRTPCAEKNDKLGWEDGFAFQIGGITVGYRSNEKTLIQELRETVSQGFEIVEEEFCDFLFSLKTAEESSRKGQRNKHLIYYHWSPRFSSLDLEDLMERLRNYPTVVERFTKHTVFIPSVVARNKQGKTLVFYIDHIEPETLLKELESHSDIDEVISSAGLFLDSSGEFLSGYDFWGKDFKAEDLQRKPVHPDRLLFVEAEEREPSELSSSQSLMELMSRSRIVPEPEEVLEPLAKNLSGVEGWLCGLKSAQGLIG